MPRRSKSEERRFRTKSMQVFGEKTILESINSYHLGVYFFIVICYFLIGTFFFYYFEDDWTVFDSFYFIIITFLTIGNSFFPLSLTNPPQNTLKTSSFSSQVMVILFQQQMSLNCFFVFIYLLGLQLLKQVLNILPFILQKKMK